MTAVDLALPLKITEHDEAFGITDAAGKSVAWVYFDDGCPIRRGVRNRLTKESARLVAQVTARALTDRVEAEKRESPPSGTGTSERQSLPFRS